MHNTCTVHLSTCWHTHISVPIKVKHWAQQVLHILQISKLPAKGNLPLGQSFDLKHEIQYNLFALNTFLWPTAKGEHNLNWLYQVSRRCGIKDFEYKIKHIICPTPSLGCLIDTNLKIKIYYYIHKEPVYQYWHFLKQKHQWNFLILPEKANLSLQSL